MRCVCAICCLIDFYSWCIGLRLVTCCDRNSGTQDTFDSKREWTEIHVGGTENREPSETDERIKIKIKRNKLNLYRIYNIKIWCNRLFFGSSMSALLIYTEFYLYRISIEPFYVPFLDFFPTFSNWILFLFKISHNMFCSLWCVALPKTGKHSAQQ